MFDGLIGCVATVKTSALLKAVLFLSLSAVGIVLYLFLLSVFRGKLGAFSGAVPAMLLALFALILNWRFLRFDEQSLAAIGINAPWLRLWQAAIGFVAGCAIVAVWALVLRAATPVSWHPVPSLDLTAAAGVVTFAIFNNAGEELVYRGYLFLLLSRSHGRAVAVVSTCCLFTLLHIQGGVPWQNAVAGVFTSALVFAALFLRWRSLPLVLAFHVGTNFMQELIGLRISGLTLFLPTYGEKIGKSQGYRVLVVTGLINLTLAFVILSSARRHKPI